MSTNEKGGKNEDRFFRLLSDHSKLPEWIVGALPTTAAEDRDKGIDFYVVTNMGPVIYVDVKSSERGKRNHVKKHGSESEPESVCIIVMRDDLGDDEMRERIVKILEQWKSRHPM